MSFAKYFSAAAMLLAGTAGAFYWRSVQSAPSEYINRRILTPDSYKEIATCIRKVFSEQYWKEIKKSRDERRKYIPDSGEYQDCVLNFQKTIKRLLEEATVIVLQEYRVSKEIFEESVNFYDSDFELKDFGDNLIKPLSQDLPPAKISINDTRKILHYFDSKLKDKNSECLELDDYIVATCQIEDEVYKSYRIEVEDVTNMVERNKSEFEEIVDSMKQQTSSILASADTSY